MVLVAIEVGSISFPLESTATISTLTHGLVVASISTGSRTWGGGSPGEDVLWTIHAITPLQA